MRTGFENYDAWKTASPHDSEPDPIDEADKWLKMRDDPNRECGEFSPRELGLLSVIEGLLQVLEDEGIIL